MALSDLQSMRTSAAPAEYPDMSFSASRTSSSSPMSALMENEAGKPLQLHGFADMVVEGWKTVVASHLCDNRWKGPVPMRRTAKTEVTNDKMERSWTTESDRKSHTAMVNSSEDGVTDDEGDLEDVAKSAC